MSVIQWVLLLVVASWALGLMTLGFAEAMLRKRDRENLEMRAFQEKIEAMRRMADREGNA